MNKCNFLGRFYEDPILEDAYNTTVCNFRVNVEEYRKDKDGYSKKRNNILNFEAWDTAAKAIVKQGKRGDYIVLECIARSYSNNIVFRVTSFKIFNNVENNEQKN
jgi:single-stranded DNA-binding protein